MDLAAIAAVLDEVADLVGCGTAPNDVARHVGRNVLHVDNTPELGPVLLAYAEARQSNAPKGLSMRLGSACGILGRLAARKPAKDARKRLRRIAEFLRRWPECLVTLQPAAAEVGEVTIYPTAGGGKTPGKRCSGGRKKDPAVQTRNKKIAGDFKKGLDVDAIADKYGISADLARKIKSKSEKFARNRQS